MSIFSSYFSSYQSITNVAYSGAITNIGDYTFRDCRGLTSVTIPDSVTSIGEGAFYYCRGLTSVTIPSSVTSIGSYAFDGCSGLTDLAVSQYVMGRGVGNVVFSSGASTLRHLVLDATVSAIHENSFAGCKSLTTIEVDASNTRYFVSSADGCLYDIGRTTLLCCPRDKTSITIPYGVTKIANYAFYYCTNLVSVSMPVTLTSIGPDAFYGCSGLTSVTIPDSVTSIGYEAFRNCSGLTRVTIPDSVTSIGNSAFRDCSGLTSVTIPDSVTSIGGSAFGNCRNLRGVTIPSGVRELSTTAFDGCNVLWTDWYRALANLAVTGGGSSGGGSSGGGGLEPVDPRYALTDHAADRAIASVTVDGDCAIDSFVLKDGKVYDSVLRIVNTSAGEVHLTLPAGYVYETFKGAKPLTIPANSRNMLTITRTADDTFLVSREELETVR